MVLALKVDTGCLSQASDARLAKILGHGGEQEAVPLVVLPLPLLPFVPACIARHFAFSTFLPTFLITYLPRYLPIYLAIYLGQEAGTRGGIRGGVRPALYFN